MKRLIPLLFLASPLLADGNEVPVDPCPSGVVGLCTPSETSVIIDTLIEEEIIQQLDGTTTITTTTDTVETTIITNETTLDLLDGETGIVSSNHEGDMDKDWGGQGPAAMPTGEACGGIEDSGKCAGINGTGSFTTTQGVENVGTTYIQTITLPDNPISNGGKTTYSIDVDKTDKEDNIYIHITGNNNDGVAFSGTDVLSATGVESGFQTYTGGFDFSGGLTSMTVEIGGRNLGITMDYALFDNVSINVIYNAIQTIIDYHITTMEMFVALEVVIDDVVIDVIEDIIDHNNIMIDDNGDFNMTPIDMPELEINYETVELEMESFDMPEVAEMNDSFEVIDIEDVQAEINLPVAEPEEVIVEVTLEVEEVEVEVAELEPAKPEVKSEPEPKPEPEETVEDVQKETKQEEPEPKAEPEQEPEQKQAEAKSEDKDSKQDAKVEKSNSVKDKQQTAAKKIITKMGDKGKYDNTNQIKTLLVMQVLGNSKSFFEERQLIEDTQGFFTTARIKDTHIKDNGLASFVMFGGSNAKMDDIVNTQYNRRTTWLK